jgi:hypothetical protein
MHRRRHGRIRTPGLACHLSNQLGTPLSIDNLSLGGAYLVTPTPLREGSTVTIDLVGKELKKAIRLSGRVVSTFKYQPGGDRTGSRPGMGIQFDALNQEAEVRLQALLASIAPGPAVLEGDRRPEAAVKIERKEPQPLSMDLLRQPAPQPGAMLEDEPLMVAQSLAPPLPPVAPKPIPLQPARPPLAVRNGGLEEVPRNQPPPEVARLMVQVRGLMLQLAEWQLKADTFEREKLALAAEVAKLRAEMARTYA